MKEWFNLKRVIAIIAAVSVTACGCMFFVMYSNSHIKEKAIEGNHGKQEQGEVHPSAINVITPDNMCSYGELMFAYIGKNNYLYNLDNDKKPLIMEPATSLLYASDDTVLYTAAAETDANHPGREYVIQELQIGEKENTLNTISTVSVPPCWSSNDEVIYFVEESNRKQLCTFEPLTSTTEKAALFKENINGLRISSDGLLVTLQSGEEQLYVPLSKSLTQTHFDSRDSIIKVCEQYDLVITARGELFYRWIGSNDAVKISDEVVSAQGFQDDEILYIKKTKDGSALYDYYVSEEKNKKLCALPEKVLPQLTVSAEYSFVIDETQNVYRYDNVNNKLDFFTHIDKDVVNPMISVFDYRLMIYDLARKPNDNFVCEYDAAKIIKDKKPKKRKKENEMSILMMTSVGEDVLKLQEKLISYGYLQTIPSGVFDINTMIAIKYMQNDMGVLETGVADPRFRMSLENDNQVNYEKYKPLSETSKGIRVNDVNERLLTLGYMPSAGGSIFNEVSFKALDRFAIENSIKRQKIIGKKYLEKLFDKNALEYSGYFTLKKGDLCVKTKSLNERLRELGYISGSVNPSFDKKTLDGINNYQKANGLKQIRVATVGLQKSIFSEHAKKCPKNFAPAKITDTNSKNKGQVISDRQLKIIRKWLTKQFAINHTDKQAVKRLQKQLEISGYLDSKDISMIYDRKTFNAVKEFQNNNKITPDGIASKKTLTTVFSSTTAS